MALPLKQSDTALIIDALNLLREKREEMMGFLNPAIVEENKVCGTNNPTWDTADIDELLDRMAPD